MVVFALFFKHYCRMTNISLQVQWSSFCIDSQLTLLSLRDEQTGYWVFSYRLIVFNSTLWKWAYVLWNRRTAAICHVSDMYSNMVTPQILILWIWSQSVCLNDSTCLYVYIRTLSLTFFQSYIAQHYSQITNVCVSAHRLFDIGVNHQFISCYHKHHLEYSIQLRRA